LRRFRSVRSEDLGFLQADLVLESGVVKGTIDNRSSLTLSEPLLLLENGCLDLGTPLESGMRTRLEGNQPKSYAKVNASTVAFTRAVFSDSGSNYPSRYGHGLGIGMGATPYGGSPQRRILATLERRLSRMSRSPESLPALLVGRVERDPQGVSVAGSSAPALERIYVVCELQLGLEGIVRLRDLPPRVVGHTEHYQAVSGATGSSPLLGGGISAEAWVGWSWQVPASPDRPFQTSHLEFKWTLDPNPVTPKLASFEAYNFAVKGWMQIIDPGELQYRLEDNRFWPHPDDGFDEKDFVHEQSGLVLIRLRNGGNDVLVRRVTLDVNGRR
jgi:hypothetical protein